MALRYSSTRILHDDHMATLALLAEVGRSVVSRPTSPAQVGDETGSLIDRFCKALKIEVSSHFDLEEISLLPILAEHGKRDLGELLIEEHRVLRDVARDIVAQAQTGRANGFSVEDWGTFRRLCGELVERLRSHIDKEEQALIPALEDALTPEIDSKIVVSHNC